MDLAPPHTAWGSDGRVGGDGAANEPGSGDVTRRPAAEPERVPSLPAGRTRRPVQRVPLASPSARRALLIGCDVTAWMAALAGGALLRDPDVDVLESASFVRVCGVAVLGQLVVGGGRQLYSGRHSVGSPDDTANVAVSFCARRTGRVRRRRGGRHDAVDGPADRPAHRGRTGGRCPPVLSAAPGPRTGNGHDRGGTAGRRLRRRRRGAAGPRLPEGRPGRSVPAGRAAGRQPWAGEPTPAGGAACAEPRRTR